MRILENNLSVFKLSLFILFSCLSIGCYGWYKLSAFDASVDKLIEKTCSPDAQCEIRIANATDFDWDEMFVFRSGLTNADVEHILPAARGFRGEFNDKVAFFNNGKLVRLVEEPEVIEGEYFPDGTIFISRRRRNLGSASIPTECDVSSNSYQTFERNWIPTGMFKLPRFIHFP